MLNKVDVVKVLPSIYIVEFVGTVVVQLSNILLASSN